MDPNAHDQDHLPAFNDEEQQNATDAAVISETLAWIPSLPPAQKFRTLELPVVIPQIQPNSFRSGPMPYCRAYAPALTLNAVSCADFVAFIDNLTIAQAPAAPFKALQLAGQGVGFVPHHWAQAASAGIGMAAGVGSATVSITRTKIYMKKVNEQYFVPRGLKATIVNDEQLRAIVHADSPASALAPLDVSSNVLTVAERRIKALEQYISPLDFNLPAPEQQANVLDRLAAKQIQISIKRNHDKAVKEAHKHGLDPSGAVTAQEWQSGKISTTGYANDLPQLDNMPSLSAAGSQSSSSQDLEQDAKIQALNLEIREINVKAERRMLEESRDKRKEKIEKDKVREIAKVQKKIDDRMQALSQSGDGSSNDGSKRDRKSSGHHEDSKKDKSKKGRKQEQKEVEKAAKLKWIIVDSLESPRQIDSQTVQDRGISL